MPKNIIVRQHTRTYLPKIKFRADSVNMLYKVALNHYFENPPNGPENFIPDDADVELFRLSQALNNNKFDNLFSRLSQTAKTRLNRIVKNF